MKTNLYFIRTKLNIFSMRPGTKSTRNEQKSKVQEKVAFLERINVQRIRNNMHQLRPLRNYLFLNRE